MFGETETSSDSIQLSFQLNIPMSKTTVCKTWIYSCGQSFPFSWMWTLAQQTVLACIPLHLMVTRLWMTTCTDVDVGRRSDERVKVHYFYVWHFFARWYSVTVQLNWSGSFAHSSIKTLLLMHSESWCWLGAVPCWVGATTDALFKKSLNPFFKFHPKVTWCF